MAGRQRDREEMKEGRSEMGGGREGGGEGGREGGKDEVERSLCACRSTVTTSTRRPGRPGGWAATTRCVSILSTTTRGKHARTCSTTALRASPACENAHELVRLCTSDLACTLVHDASTNKQGTHMKTRNHVLI